MTGGLLAGILWAVVLGTLASQALALMLLGHQAYLWVQGTEALAASAALLWLGIRYRTRDPRHSRWPPLLPLAAIAATGGAKDLCVALDRPTPWWLVALLLGSVVWLLAATWTIWRVERGAPPH